MILAPAGCPSLRARRGKALPALPLPAGRLPGAPAAAATAGASPGVSALLREWREHRAARCGPSRPGRCPWARRGKSGAPPDGRHREGTGTRSGRGAATARSGGCWLAWVRAGYQCIFSNGPHWCAREINVAPAPPRAFPLQDQ